MLACSVSIDLDEIACYSSIHGLLPGAECHAVYDVALGRALEFAKASGLPLTLFVIARDLDRAQNHAMLRRAVREGHEIANHSLDHLYDLTHRDLAEQTRQVVEANRRISAQLGVRAVGFRAPGYVISDRLLSVLRDAGFGYDSSVFPCPAYYAAKAAALFAIRMRRRESRSVLDTVNVLRAPRAPYHAGEPYWARGSGILELPIQVVGPLRLPFIGTSLSLLGPSASRALTRGLLGTPFVNLELHGLDFLEAADVPKQLALAQPDLRVPILRKLECFNSVLGTLRSNGYATLRLDDAARVVAANLAPR